MAFTFDYPLTIREFHLDSFGHMNNATYLQIFEEARWEFITQRGFGMKEVQTQKKGPIILSIEINFKKEIRNREKVVIQSKCLDYSGKIGKVQQSVLNDRNEEACVAVFTFGFFDMKERKLIPPSKEWLYAIGWTQ